jgi:endonuclease G, mitochondrial
MVPKALIDRTVARFNERTSQRQDQEAKLKSGSTMAANTPARIDLRLARLAAGERARAIVAPARTIGPVPAPVSLIERILGTNDLMSVTFLKNAVAAAHTVARIRIRSGTRTVGYGTGSLVGSRVLMTNNHVLETAADAAASLAEFNYQDGEANPTVFDLDPASLFITDPDLDYTLVAVRERGTGQALISSFGFNRLIEQEGKILVGECLNIVQHPNGELKQLALRENQLKDILPQFLHYHTDTAPGSSGSPVFNDQWEVVALHHSGVPAMNAQGQYLTKDGTAWEPSMGEQRIHWLANEGARVSQIVAHLKSQTLTGTARTLRDAILNGESAPVEVRTPQPVADVSAINQALHVADDGTATWTVPIQISIRVGGQPAASLVGARHTPDAPAPTLPPPRPGSSTILAPTDADLQEALDAAAEGQVRPYYEEAADVAARDVYYAGINPADSPQTLFTALSTLLKSTHTPKPSYKPATHVYPFVDLHPDRKLRSIYSQKTFGPEELIREDFRIEQARAERLQEMLAASPDPGRERTEDEVSLLEAALPFNCEHVVPQSWFSKREPMRGDLHHLFACEPNCNSFRGNIPYFDFPDFMEAIRDACGKRDGTRFEPGAAKGAVARATLYFLLRYPDQISDSYDAARLSTLLSWHATHPVTEYEKHRNMAIAEKQGNRNPLIDHPEWASKIDFSKGL